MGKLSEIIKKNLEKFNGLSNGKKIAFGVSLVGVLTILVYLSITLGSTKYGVLFSDLEPNEAKAVVDKLKEQKVTDVKISGNKILVSEELVDQLRLELAPTITSGSDGWGLFDGGNTFASTDAELRIKYQRALQGELEKTIKSFPQVDKAKVNLVLPEESVFVKDSTPASASVTLMMKAGQTLNNDQVKAIVSLVSGSVENLPKENIQIVDNNMKLLTQDLFNEDKVDLTNATEKQQTMKKEYEKQLESKVMEQLSKPFKNKVTVKVNADLDFDAVQNVTTTVDKEGTPISEKTITSTTGANANRPGQSPVDNSMGNTTPTETTISDSSSHQEKTVNYQVGQSETKTIKAPGSVKRVTASIIIDGNIDENLKTQINGLVANAIGFDEKRGDAITVEGIRFDTSDNENTQKAIEEMKSQEAKDKQMALYKMIAAGVGGLILLIILVIMLRKGNKRSPQEEQLEAIVSPKGIDVLIGDSDKQAKVTFNPINFDMEANNEKAHVEKEIKRYATEKPEQVADIIKSWLAEDER
jgi:flagellar M-ring protein FliF